MSNPLTTPDAIFGAMTGASVDYFSYGDTRQSIYIRELTGEEVQLIFSMTVWIERKRQFIELNSGDTHVTNEIHADEIAPDDSTPDRPEITLYVSPEHERKIEKIFEGRSVDDDVVYSAYALTLLLSDQDGNRIMNDSHIDQVIEKFPNRDSKRLFERYVRPHMFVSPGDLELKN